MKKILVILLATLSVASIASANLVLNDGFETGAFNDWFHSSGSTVQSNSVNTGTWAAELPVNNDIRSVSFAVTGGSSYDFNWAYELSGNTTGDWAAQLRWFSDPNATSWIGEYTWTTITDTSWTSVSQTGIVAPEAAQSADVVFKTGSAVSGTFRVDDVAVIPEPATLSMVATVGVAMLFIRKKNRFSLKKS